MPVYNNYILYEIATGNIVARQTFEFESAPTGFATANLGKRSVDIFTQRYDVANDAIVDRADADQIISEKYRDQIRSRRNALLSDSDWTELPSNQARHTQEWITAWADYRQQLRDFMSTVPAVIDQNYQPTWPVPPSQ